MAIIGGWRGEKMAAAIMKENELKWRHESAYSYQRKISKSAAAKMAHQKQLALGNGASEK
jgi:hypothetical protein